MTRRGRGDAPELTCDLVLLHSSDELYGADRMLLEVLAAVPADQRVEVWLPTDLEHGPHPLCVELEAAGHRVEHVDMPVLRRSYATPTGLLRLLRRCLPLWRRLRVVRPTAVYCATSATLVSAPVARLAGVGSVMGHLQEVWTRTERLALTVPGLACGSFVAVSRAVADSVPGPLRRRTRVVANATPDPGPVVPMAKAGPVRFLVASRWVRPKGLHTLLAAWAELLERAPDTAATLVVLGAAPPIGESVDVRGLVSALSRPESVEILGEVRDIGEQISRADVVLMPSERPEPFGLVAIEAFARARPVVASRAGGLVDIVSEGETGWFVERGDVEDLAARLVTLAAAPRSELKAAGEAARADYDERFRPEQFAAAWRAAVTGTAI